MAACTTIPAACLSRYDSTFTAQTSASSSSRASAGSSSYGGEPTLGSDFWGSRRSGGRSVNVGNSSNRLRRNERSGAPNVCIRASGFNFWQVLGGRGLKGGEISTNTEDGRKALFAEPEGEGKKKGKGDNVNGRVEVEGIDGFEKELSGLVGGFPGGEKGLGRFLEVYPPPAKPTKASEEREKLKATIASPAAKPKTVIPPLLLPGMTVIVKEPTHPYYMFTGILQSH
jgi:hypothetical protein